MKYFDFAHITFAHPAFFWLLLLIPALIYFYFFKAGKRHLRHTSLIVTTQKDLQHVAPTFKTRLRSILPVFRITALFFLIIALARPQNSQVNETINNDGIDIILSMDISGSMLAQDLKPNRIEAAKKVAGEFILNRPTDRIGLVIFSGESFSQCPLTTDQNVLLEQVKNIRSGLLEDGTAIGMGLATSVERLRKSSAKSKIIILMTDGVNNSGLIDPVTALEIAKAYKIRVYTIGVGTRGNAPYPVQDQFGNTAMQMVPVQIDEALMEKISKETGGKYFRATDNTSLNKIYSTIDQLEKTNIEISSYKRYAELFFIFAFAGLFLVFLELVIRYAIVRSIND